MPIKVYELAKELRITNTEALGLLNKVGLKGLTPGTDLDDRDAERVREAYAGDNAGNDGANGAARVGNGVSSAATAGSNGANAPQQPRPASQMRPPIPGGGAGPAAKAPAPAAGAAPAASGEPVDVPLNVSIKELADRLKISASEIQKILMGKGVLAGLNQRLAPDAVNYIAQKLGRTVRTGAADAATQGVPAAPTAAPGQRPGAAPGGATVSGMRAPVPQPRPGEGQPTPTAHPQAGPALGQGTRPVQQGPREQQRRTVQVQGKATLVPRPPVVTIMGHVDHGKTTLLDAIRKTSIASGEAGGITQHIGAYQVEVNGQRITFLDTPGHAAFSSMRARGARVTDIIILVVAADDSIMPQTEEAIKLAKDAGVPMIVAINKVDLPDADPTRVMTDLTMHDVMPTAYGGDVETVSLSAKTGEGLNDLLEMILLVSEAVVEPKADPNGAAQGTIIEAKVDKGRGAVSTVLVQQGTLKQGDVVVVGPHFGRIRTMTDDRGNKLQKAGPSTPVEIVGLNSAPEPGDRLTIAKDEKEARVQAQQREADLREERLSANNRVTLEGLYMQLIKGVTKELNVVIKGDVQGTVQAVRDSIADLGNDEVRVRVLSTGVGAITESDVLLAASDKDAEEKNSLIVGFNVGVASSAEKKAEVEHVQIKTFTIIYELIDAVKDALVALLDPIYEESPLGKATVRALFKLPGSRVIAGSYVTDGIVRRNAKARLHRGKDVLYTGDIESLRRFTEDAREVARDYECGITLRGWNDIQEGDIIECFEMRQIPREL